ncbi:MAG: acyl-ACP--UDP-N-acetylglucosamine O-acyltransferase [Candidatus Cloacimonetes bacterium]|nr:acyl-ACP--UDP-N-acetylglucosamine O-acyltransferase [Candidatus Cloacimonadota bacterium]
MNEIHPTAIVSPKAELGDHNIIGPFSIIGSQVKMGNNNNLHSSVILDGNTVIGDGNEVFHSAVIGTDSQDLKYKGEDTRLEIGDYNRIREFVTINKSATLDEPTVLGSNCLLMAYSHVAHNCSVGSNVIIANSVNLAGHIKIEDFVTIGGASAISQFVRIGSYAFIGGVSGIQKDIPPYTRGIGLPYRVIGINSVGLQRHGFSEAERQGIKEIFKIFYLSNLNVSQALEKIEKMNDLTVQQQYFIEFVKTSERGICRG